MTGSNSTSHHLVRQGFVVQFVSLVVGLHGMAILATGLLEQLGIHHTTHLSELVFDLPLLIGLTLLYLSRLLWRRKQTAWAATVLAYTFYLGVSLPSLAAVSRLEFGAPGWLEIIKRLIVPLGIIGLLYISRRQFVVRSDVQSIRGAARFSVLILVAALIYGTVGFGLMDESDFHQEIRWPTALHYTIDQFDLTTARPLQLYTKRAHVFTDSLSVVSIGALSYALLSLFQPLKIRLSDQRKDRQLMHGLLTTSNAHSEDYFKLWPHDKLYFFDATGTAGLAYHVSRGVALCLGDPVGRSQKFGSLLESFTEQCFRNDWLPALVHVQAKHQRLYKKYGFSMQRIGQEAVVDLEHFQSTVVRSKYFRHITNKFNKHGFSCELLSPPHNAAVLERLHHISNEWLGAGRTERGFVMGYYFSQYIQQCQVLVARDAAGTIQAFINQVPAEFDRQEATFDMLRSTSSSMGNINDFLLINFIASLQQQGFKRLNLGLCPLVGLDKQDEDTHALIDGVLRFAYANGDRFYSFSGLQQFKAKYEPEWRDRYIAYPGGVRGFSRTMAALMRAMRVRNSP